MKNKNVLRKPIAQMDLKTTRIVVIIQKSLDDMSVNFLEEQLSITKKVPYTEVKRLKCKTHNTSANAVPHDKSFNQPQSDLAKATSKDFSASWDYQPGSSSPVDS